MSRKRSRSAEDGNASDSSDDDFGPALPSTVPPRKKRKLPYEALYVAALPKGIRYSKSLMHKDQLTNLTMASSPVDFLITSSVDGVVKFWKKTPFGGVDFAKQYQAHEGRIRGTASSHDGAFFATVGDDKTIKIFDVVTFDLLSIINLEDIGGVVCWIHSRGSPPLLAVSIGKEIHIYDGRGDRQEPLKKLTGLHRTDVIAMAYNPAFDCVVSADASGMIEYWQPGDTYEKPDNVFKMKSSTNLFDFKKAKSAPCCISISPQGHQFATFSFPDRNVRLFDFVSGKLLRSYDESIESLTAMQEAGTSIQKLDQNEFNRRLAVERDLDNPAVRSRINICFDESGNFIAYGSLHGIKVVNTTTNRVMRLYGKDEPFRALNLAIYQGAPDQKGLITVSMATSSNPLLEAAEERDPMLFATGYGKLRFYIFTNDENPSKSDRDVHNEKPKQLGKKAKDEPKQQITGSAATIHTNMGDIHIKLFPQHTPKTFENFTTHARNGYYNNTIFHRVIRRFMIQGGDPLGDGTGGTSIWGKEFEDEFHPELKHDRLYTVSMANAGPNTNGSQFFITTAEKADWLDGKHTVFGRVERGKDVVHLIENVRVNKEKPEEDVKIINISVH